MKVQFTEKSCLPTTCRGCPFMRMTKTGTVHQLNCGYYELVQAVPRQDYASFQKPNFCRVRQIKILEDVE